MVWVTVPSFTYPVRMASTLTGAPARKVLSLVLIDDGSYAPMTRETEEDGNPPWRTAESFFCLPYNGFTDRI